MHRMQIAIVGPNASNASPQLLDSAYELGKRLIDEGYQIVCGGMGGVMEAACKGARESEAHYEGATIGILPGDDGTEANPFVDIAIKTGLGLARNILVVSSADVVIAVGGGAGTLSEIAYAWQLNKAIIGLDIEEGWSARLAGMTLDNRRDDHIIQAASVDYTMEFLTSFNQNLDITDLPSSHLIGGRWAIQEVLRERKFNRGIFKCIDTEGDQIGVAKVHQFVSNSDFDKLKKEIEIIQSISHPNCISLLDHGEHVDPECGRYCYFVTPIFDHDLSQINPLDNNIETWINLFDSLISLIEELHERGIVHRDIKPSNIVYNSKNPQLVLLDFYTNVCPATKTELKKTIQREDIYNLGKLFYYLMSGKYEIKLNMICDLQEIRDSKYWDLDKLRDVILKACDLNWRTRFKSINDMRVAIARAWIGGV